MRPRKPPRLYLRSSGLYVILDGDNEIATGTRALAEAEKKLQSYKSDTIRKVVEFYLSHHETKTDFSKHIAKPIIRWWDTKTLAEIDERNCWLYRDSRTPHVALATVRHELKLLRTALNYWVGYHKNGPAPKVWLPPKPPAKSEYFLTRSQVAARLRIARRSPYHKHICRVLLIGVYSGTRPGAALSLSWLPSTTTGYFDLERQILHRGPETSQNKRKGRARIHQRLLVHLKRWRRLDLARGITHCVHVRSEPVRDVHKAWRWVAKKAGQPEDGPHICRHTCATWLMQSGVPLYQAAGFLSMTAETLEERYGHHHPDFQEEAAKARGR